MKKIYFVLVLLVMAANVAFAQITSTAAGGNWSNPGTWVGGNVPNGTNNVVIANGATVTINVDAAALSLTVGQGTSGILQFEQNNARTLTVGNDVTVAAGGTFRTSLAGTQDGHELIIGGSLTNNGTLDFSTNAGAAGALITFTGTTNEIFGGTGAVTDVNAITVDKGANQNAILELNTTNFTFQGNTVTPGNGDNAFLSIVNGTFKLSGTFSSTNGLFTGAVNRKVMAQQSKLYCGCPYG
jgi:hypothetical protein